MTRDKAYHEAEDTIRKLQELGRTILHLNYYGLTEIPEILSQFTSLQELHLSNSHLSELPQWIGDLKQLRVLDVSSNKLMSLPDSLRNLTNLKTLDISNNQFDTLPEFLSNLNQLQSLNVSANKLHTLPDSLRGLAEIRYLDVSNNQLGELPDLTSFANLRILNCSLNKLFYLPTSLFDLIYLYRLEAESNRLVEIPNSLGKLKHLQHLNISGNQLLNPPESFDKLPKIEYLDLSNNLLKDIPISIYHIEKLKEAEQASLSRNRKSKGKRKKAKTSRLASTDTANMIFSDYESFILNDERSGGGLFTLNLNENPLNPELAEAYRHGIPSVMTYLRAKAKAQITLNEAKLILIGEGEVGKTCLISALCDEPFVEGLPPTHGIDIKSVELADSQTSITLNAWDFGGQRVYRPTHQLFFSAPAVYLVVWKPREGSQAGQVKEWIQLVKRREPSAKILVVATHGGPQQRQPDIDRQEMWDLFGHDTVVDFFFVESKPDEHGQRKGIDKLKRAIAQVAASLPEVGRSVPKSFADVRQALQETGKAYLPLREVLDICRAHNMDDEIARLFITISHRLGHLTHYENDPTLRDIVILRPDWLATAMSYVLDDEETRAKHGLVNFSRLSHLWDDPNRAADSRYEKNLHPIFLRLMERFDLSYRVADPTSRGRGDPSGRPYADTTSLIGQLVPDIRPQNLSVAWESSPASGDVQQTQICHIVDASNGQSASAEGLFYQLIVRLHKYSLGRVDYNASVHWQRGLVLEDEYKSRAFLEHVGNDVRITVRSPYPEGLLGMLTREVKFLVESFWEGLRCDVMVPCVEPCGKDAPGTGLYNVSNLMESKREGQPKYPCPVCNKWQDIASLLRNAPAAAQSISLVELQSEFTAIKDRLDENNVLTRRVLSQVDKTYTDLLQVLTDEAKEGPRLFSFFPVDRSTFNPKEWIRAKFRLVLWCEHSRLPLPVLNNGDMKKGVYDLELDREWFKKSAPYLKFLTGTLGMVLPVASSAVKLALNETAYKLIEEQLDFGKSIIDAAISEGGKVSDFLGAADSSTLENSVAARADGSTLRELHALLKAKDPGFGGLVRVMNKRQEFLWVHEKFAGEY
jgi:Leucine-rich repeat (LRR) protein